LPLSAGASDRTFITINDDIRAIEEDAFPFEKLSEIAEVESWRKEICRPIYHIHKWWAQRLGTVFRAILIAAFAPKNADIVDLFYKPVRIPGVTVFDPFMGSGTTIGEAAKLGARAIGRDINPVAHFLVRNALTAHDRQAVARTFREIARDVAGIISRYYRVTAPNGHQADVLYYFWVKTVECPACTKSVDLFSNYVFARHAYPRKYPRAQAVCPHCGDISPTTYDASCVHCSGCGAAFDPRLAPARGQKARCPYCAHSFLIAKRIRELGQVPNHKLYAKLVLMPDGTKLYLPTDNADRLMYREAASALAERSNAFPVVKIEPGYNTNQALGYNYRYWHEMFNARQLLCLSVLADKIKDINEPVLQELFTCLLSGVLEFNNVFTSYKGEGTGAVRHMFAHHILKPERTPLEANVWGTPKSSGAFSTMFNGRIRRALDYSDEPFEIRISAHVGRKRAQKVFGLSDPMGCELAESYSDFVAGSRVYLSCGDSSTTDLPNSSIDAVITDPPFFDNVHYSQLADFFHVWQRHILGSRERLAAPSTRSDGEVQSSDAGTFTDRLGLVWLEAHRVLKDNGVLVFTYHHSRPEGWQSILQALMKAGFGITATHPIKSEMSVAMPKHQAKEPIDLDVIIVCRKRSQLQTRQWNGDLWNAVSPFATRQVTRLRIAGRRLSRNDVRIIVTAQLLRQLSAMPSLESALSLLDASSSEIEKFITNLHAGPTASPPD
jgi:adenine-specific DNA methylase